MPVERLGFWAIKVTDGRVCYDGSVFVGYPHHDMGKTEPSLPFSSGYTRFSRKEAPASAMRMDDVIFAINAADIGEVLDRSIG